GGALPPSLNTRMVRPKPRSKPRISRAGRSSSEFFIRKILDPAALLRCHFVDTNVPIGMCVLKNCFKLEAQVFIEPSCRCVCGHHKTRQTTNFQLIKGVIEDHREEP